MSDHFENKIREKLQDADFPFDQQAWSKMEAQLNALAPTHKRRSFLRWWWGGLILLLGIAGGITVSYNVNPPTETVTQQQTNKDVDSPVGSGTNKQINAENNKELVNAVASKTSTASSSPLSASKIATEKVTKPNKVVDNSKDKSASEAAGITVVKKADSYTQPNADNVVTETKSVKKSDLSTLNGDDKQIVVTTPMLFKNINGVSAANIHVADTLSTKTPVLATTTMNNRLPEKRGWALGLAVGPDYSVAPCLQMGNFGVNAGLQLQYAFNNRWSVSTAAIYAKKIYGATKADYSSPYNFEKVQANCDVIDVPLNLNYTLFQSGVHSWSATLGASSYFMLKEDYNYYYLNSPPKKYVYQNENRHYFSVLNIGIGYQQQSARHVMWGIQPYAKIPMAGVGNGKVKLTSLGVMFHINLTQY